jgi:hypothetical protein
MTVLVLALLVLPAFVGAQYVSSGSTPSGDYGTGGASRNVDEYCLDDNSADLDLALLAGGELVWIHVFDTLEGLETITHVNSAIGVPGTSVPNTSQLGAPLRVYVWDDPDNDGNPGNAVLLAEAVGTITHVDDDVLNRVALDQPVTVSGKFVIGASVVHPPGEYPAPRDVTSGSWCRAWVTGVEGGPFDPHSIGGSIGIEEMDDLGFPSVWLLSASAAGCPGDVDGDGDVDLSDLADLLGAYGTCEGDPLYSPAADFDDSGCVDLADLTALLAKYGYGV